jgi:hypothetical protein
MYAVEMGSGVIIYVSSFMKIGGGVEGILRFCLRNLKSCNAGITDERDLSISPLIWAQVARCTYQIHADRFRYLSNVTGITATISRGCNIGIIQFMEYATEMLHVA